MKSWVSHLGSLSTICRCQWSAWLTDSWIYRRKKTIAGQNAERWWHKSVSSVTDCQNESAQQHCWTPPQNIFTLPDLGRSLCSRQWHLEPRAGRAPFNSHSCLSWFCLSSADTSLKRCSSTMNECGLRDRRVKMQVSSVTRLILVSKQIIEDTRFPLHKLFCRMCTLMHLKGNPAGFWRIFICSNNDNLIREVNVATL